MNLSKPEACKDFIFLTFITKESQESIFNQGIFYHRAKLRVSITREKEATMPSELHISTTLLVNNLPQKESQNAIVITLKKKFGMVT